MYHYKKSLRRLDNVLQDSLHYELLYYIDFFALYNTSQGNGS